MRIVLPVLVFALTLYALLDCARTPEESMPARMPKFLWITLVVLFPAVGPIAWIIVSRVKAAEERGGYVEPTVWSSKEGTTFRRPQRARPVAPDDDPEFLRDLEQDIRRRRHHPGKSAGGRDADGAGEETGRETSHETGKDAGETDDSDRSGSDRH
ncbi:PLD nuclease N-terminal domain-containing protein [Actinomyces sp. ZJ308]|uniref:PLD nuclease N-terminal domain-containing protein n=1 Tax=Actinomyces sp. ZJ308 TaxID=2708342 RepID=UPI0014247AB6|nr:PLD nuclease N-terminal domain-containing protein [Actinomyces sp. ZJ308]